MKKEKNKLFLSYPPKIKWVKKAGSFCESYWYMGKQYQKWSAEKPTKVD